jgi:N-methylhydantoinase B
MINGAWGGRATKDGIDGVTNPSQNMSNMPVEILEATYPVLIEEYACRPDSGGAGRTRGGLGCVRQYRLLADEAVLQLRADRYVHRPYGLFGGQAGAPSRNLLWTGSDFELLTSKVTRTVRKGQVIRHEQAGGGGYGNPFERSPSAVLDDVLNQKVTPEFARDAFGVAVVEGLVDSAATEHLRASAVVRQPAQ